MGLIFLKDAGLEIAYGIFNFFFQQQIKNNKNL